MRRKLAQVRKTASAENAPAARDTRNRNRQGREGTRRRRDTGGDATENQDPLAVLCALSGRNQECRNRWLDLERPLGTSR